MNIRSIRSVCRFYKCFGYLRDKLHYRLNQIISYIYENTRLSELNAPDADIFI